MRILVPVCAALVIGSGVFSTMMWRQMRAEHQLVEDLQAQLDEARTALAQRPPVQLAPQSVSKASIEAPAEPPAKISREAAIAVIAADSAKVQKKLMADAGFRKARLEQARLNLKRRYAGLAEVLGISEKEADAIIDMLAQNQVSMEMWAMEMTSNGTPDEPGMAELTRQQQELQRQQQDALTARLGPARYQQLQEFEQTQPSRTRVSNLGTLLAKGGRPMTSEQARSLTAVIVAEQKRQQDEAVALRTAGQDTQPIGLPVRCSKAFARHRQRRTSRTAQRAFNAFSGFLGRASGSRSILKVIWLQTPSGLSNLS